MVAITRTQRSKSRQEVALDFRTLFRKFIIDKLAQNDLAMVQLAERRVFTVFYLCTSFFH